MTFAGKTILMAILVVGTLLSAVVMHLSGDDSFQRLRRAGSIRIGYAVEPPYAFLKPGGMVTGESPEVAKKIVRILGIPRIEWRQSEFDLLIDELESERIDVIAAGMFITIERASRVLFSEPTFHVLQGLLVIRGNPRHLHSYEQFLQLKDAKIAVLHGAVEATLLRWMGLPEPQIVFVPDVLTGRVAVESGIADGLALSSPTIQWMVLHDRLGKTEMARPFDQPGGLDWARWGFGAFVFRKGDRALQTAWNEAQKGFIGSHEHRDLVGKFGFDRAEAAGSVTTAEVLGRQ